jgi:hypothetical protein
VGADVDEGGSEGESVHEDEGACASRPRWALNRKPLTLSVSFGASRVVVQAWMACWERTVPWVP